jgi:hypothetical protein
MAFQIEQQVLWFDVPMRHTLPMEVRHTREDLLEAALDFARAHPALLDRGVQVSAGAELHDLAPVLRLVLHEVDGLNDVNVVQRARDAELGGELLHVLLLRLVLATLTELLQNRSHHRLVRCTHILLEDICDKP